MMSYLRTRRSFGLVVSCCLALCLTDPTMAAEISPNASLTEYFSEGRALADAHHQTTRREEALQDFLKQAVFQATARILSPSQMETHYAILRDRIFRVPGLYVQGHQVFSEGMEGGFYRITGRVTIAMEALRRDVSHLEVLRDVPPRVESDQPVSSSREPAVDLGDGVRRDPEKPGGDLAANGKFLLWAVAEKWEKGWHVPHGRTDPHGIFAANVHEEGSAVGWLLRFPREGLLVADPSGKIPLDELVTAAKEAGVRRAVTGSVGVRRNETSSLRLAATLAVVDVDNGKTLGEIYKDLPVEEGATLDGTMELASFVVPHLDRLLHDAGRQGAPPPVEVFEPGEAPIPSEGGRLLLRIRSPRFHADWEAIEAMLREQSPNLELAGFELGEDGGLVHLRGVGRAMVNALNGMRLQGGGEIRLVEPPSAAGDVMLTVVHPEPSQSNP